MTRPPLFIAGIALLFVALFLSGCSSPAQLVTVPLLPSPRADADGLVILVHGSGHGPDDWPAELQEEMTRSLSHDWQVVRVDWEAVAERRLSAPRNGMALGRTLGTELAAESPRALHLVAHSAGAFIVHGMIEAIRDAGDARTVIHATFLDPFLARSLLQPRYGARHFGADADFAENYFTRNDAVPFTNRPLGNAWNVELDRTVRRVSDPPTDWNHTWPLIWYLETVSNAPLSLPLPETPLLELSSDSDVLEAARQVLERLSDRFPIGTTVVAQ